MLFSNVTGTHSLHSQLCQKKRWQLCHLIKWEVFRSLGASFSSSEKWGLCLAHQEPEKTDFIHTQYVTVTSGEVASLR